MTTPGLWDLNRQFTLVYLSHRAMEIDERCVYLVLVSIDTVFFNSNLPEFGDCSRELTITAGVGTKKVDMPDRRKSGSQHRVTDGNRKLCGSTRGRNWRKRNPLYLEAKDWEGGGPNVRETHRLDPIQVWFGTVGMVGGLDQLLQEFVLTKPLLKRIIELCPNVTSAK